MPDLSFHGGGMYAMPVGSRLGCHLDADRHPCYGLERRANAVLFLGLDWTDRCDWGGELQFWRPDLSGVELAVKPAYGRLVVFETTDTSYHAVAPVACPAEIMRATLSLFWWGDPAGIRSRRPRAHFVRTAGEPEDPELDRQRAARAGL